MTTRLFNSRLHQHGLALCCILTFTAVCQGWELNWFTVDGGGGTSSGGQFSVSGTIGQPDASTMNGASFTLVGGFWGVADVIQTPGAPWLSIEQVGSGVRIFWPLAATGWVLDQTTALDGSPNSWSQVPLLYQTNTTDISISLPAPTGNKFYRLRKP